MFKVSKPDTGLEYFLFVVLFVENELILSFLLGVGK